MKHVKEFQAKHGLTADGVIGAKTIAKMRCEFGSLTDAQLAHMLANIEHETGGFKSDTENLNYSAGRLLQVFPRYFQTLEHAKTYSNNPEKIANYVYGNRMGNTAPQYGDGWKYRGRGALQLTGKDNYKAFSEFLKKPEIMTNPDLVATDYFWESALFYFTRNNLWKQMKYADPNAVKAVRKAINGGTNGLAQVQELFDKYLKLIQGK